jgi:hypothetical protein
VMRKKLFILPVDHSKQKKHSNISSISLSERNDSFDASKKKRTSFKENSLYLGTERRKKNRRSGNERVEVLLKDFGLDRRLSSDRRQKDTSWFLKSKKSNE